MNPGSLPAKHANERESDARPMASFAFVRVFRGQESLFAAAQNNREHPRHASVERLFAGEFALANPYPLTE
jgi:hypothetical protein